MLSFRKFLFFCKQKTAYEVRISDWSSDVCSSDLRDDPGGDPPCQAVDGRAGAAGQPGQQPVGEGIERDAGQIVQRLGGRAPRAQPEQVLEQADDQGGRLEWPADHRRRQQRSEEHTSELQSLMRISYAVFCLKKKKNND